MCLPYDPAIPLGYNTLKKLLTYVHQMTCEKVFTRSLRITAKNWKQPK